MTTPLYQNNQADNSAPNKGHLGLWFTRFFNQYDENWQIKKIILNKKKEKENGLV